MASKVSNNSIAYIYELRFDLGGWVSFIYSDLPDDNFATDKGVHKSREESKNGCSLSYL